MDGLHLGDRIEAVITVLGKERQIVGTIAELTAAAVRIRREDGSLANVTFAQLENGFFELYPAGAEPEQQAEKKEEPRTAPAPAPKGSFGERLEAAPALDILHLLTEWGKEDSLAAECRALLTDDKGQPVPPAEFSNSNLDRLDRLFVSISRRINEIRQGGAPEAEGKLARLYALKLGCGRMLLAKKTKRYTPQRAQAEAPQADPLWQAADCLAQGQDREAWLCLSKCLIRNGSLPLEAWRCYLPLIQTHGVDALCKALEQEGCPEDTLAAARHFLTLHLSMSDFPMLDGLSAEQKRERLRQTLEKHFTLSGAPELRTEPEPEAPAEAEAPAQPAPAGPRRVRGTITQYRPGKRFGFIVPVPEEARRMTKNSRGNTDRFFTLAFVRDEALRAHLAGLAAGLAEDVCMPLNLQVTFVPSINTTRDGDRCAGDICLAQQLPKPEAPVVRTGYIDSFWDNSKGKISCGKEGVWSFTAEQVADPYLLAKLRDLNQFAVESANLKVRFASAGKRVSWVIWEDELAPADRQSLEAQIPPEKLRRWEEHRADYDEPPKAEEPARPAAAIPDFVPLPPEGAGQPAPKAPVREAKPAEPAKPADKAPEPPAAPKQYVRFAPYVQYRLGQYVISSVIRNAKDLALFPRTDGRYAFRGDPAKAAELLRQLQPDAEGEWEEKPEERLSRRFTEAILKADAPLPDAPGARQTLAAAFLDLAALEADRKECLPQSVHYLYLQAARLVQEEESEDWGRALRRALGSLYLPECKRKWLHYPDKLDKPENLLNHLPEGLSRAVLLRALLDVGVAVSQALQAGVHTEDARGLQQILINALRNLQRTHSAVAEDLRSLGFAGDFELLTDADFAKDLEALLRTWHGLRTDYADCFRDTGALQKNENAEALAEKIRQTRIYALLQGEDGADADRERTAEALAVLERWHAPEFTGDAGRQAEALAGIQPMLAQLQARLREEPTEYTYELLTPGCEALQQAVAQRLEELTLMSSI